MPLSSLAATEVKADLVYPIGIDESEIVIERLLRQQAVFACWMTKLHAQPQFLQRDGHKVNAHPLL
jgi:hypothetical protein